MAFSAKDLVRDCLASPMERLCFFVFFMRVRVSFTFFWSLLIFLSSSYSDFFFFFSSSFSKTSLNSGVDPISLKLPFRTMTPFFKIII